VRNFSDRLKRYPPRAYAELRAVRAEHELRGLLHVALGADVRAPKVIACHHQPGGVMSAMFAADLMHGLESSRLLSALGDLLRELVDAPADEIADRMGELLSAQVVIGEHMKGLELALLVARAEMRR
jgi:hypothetical protein